MSDEAITVSVDEAARMLGVSRAALYPRITSGEIPSVTLGRRRLVPVEGLREWVERGATPAEQAPA